MNAWVRTITVLLTLAVAVITTPALATEVSEDMANSYYHNCMGKPDSRLTQESQEALCSCTAVQMMKTMTVEDMRTMQENTQAGRDKLNYMLLNVYGPCMLYPVKDLVEAECKSDPKMEQMHMGISKDALCGCMAQRTGEWFASAGGDLIAQILANNPNTYDVIAPVMESQAFRKQSFDNLVQCMK